MLRGSTGPSPEYRSTKRDVPFGMEANERWEPDRDGDLGHRGWLGRKVDRLVCRHVSLLKFVRRNVLVSSDPTGGALLRHYNIWRSLAGVRGVEPWTR